MAMDNQTGFLLNWTYNLYQEKSVDHELRQSFAAAMELEEELRMRDSEITQLKALLSSAILERDEALESCRKALFEKALLQKQLQKPPSPSAPPQISVSSTIEDDHHHHPNNNVGISSSDGDDSIGSAPATKPLPEKGKLLQAVVRAGPLLQTLLLAGGPLPEWRHPPPPIDAFQIPPPPVVVPPPMTTRHETLHGGVNVGDGGRMSRKRARR